LENSRTGAFCARAALQPDTRFADCPWLDLVLVPGGPGINPLIEDAEVLAFLRQAAAGARYVVGICTGSLMLGRQGCCAASAPARTRVPPSGPTPPSSQACASAAAR
jgi:hypothetical protein